MSVGIAHLRVLGEDVVPDNDDAGAAQTTVTTVTLSPVEVELDRQLSLRCFFS